MIHNLWWAVSFFISMIYSIRDNPAIYDISSTACEYNRDSRMNTDP